ncbi:MAG: polysaccharide pyruvyl transferase CsaB [Cyanobacteria bacterium K_DeepCast_0m_m1_088]|nr:polysaccharide pyruvyl transferase CsaB [Cyanobacteria bacterium K_DeepCast_0m_m1_088]
MSSWFGSAPTRVTTSVLLCGYYGEHNLGDDALLDALLAQLPPSVTPLVTAFDQAQISRQHGVASVNRRSLRAVLKALRQCRALVLGGGSLLQDSTSFRSLLYYAALITAARLQGKPVLLWAQGLGPLRRRRSRALVRVLLPLASGITWRDSSSAQLARQLGVAAPHGTDAVWSLPRQHWLGLGGPIVVCWRPTPHLQGEAWKPYLQALEDLAEQTEREVIWLPFHRDQDQRLFDQLQQQGLVGDALVRRSRVVEAVTPSEAMALFRSASLVLAMRLHALILAALAGSPVSALSYDPKVQACATELGCSCIDLADASAEAGALLSSWLEAFEHPPALACLEAMAQATAMHRALLTTLEV